MSNKKNFSTGTVATAPSPATTGTSLTLQSGQGARLPSPPFFAVASLDGVLPDESNSEVIKVTGISTDTLTIVREQKGSTAQAIAVDWRISSTIFVEDMPMSFNIKSYGALGDGSTDDTAAIQAALDGCYAVGGGIVDAPGGTYKITSPLTTYANVIFQGAGVGITIIKQFTNNTSGILLNDGLFARVSDMSIINNGTHTAGAGIELKWTSNGNVEQMHLQDLYILDFHTAISAQTLITSQINNVEMFGCDTGLYIWDGGTSTNITNTYANDCGIGYYLDGVVYCTFNATAADGSGQAYYLHNCSGIAFVGSGCESGNHGTTPSDGRGWSLDSCSDIGFYSCWNYLNPSYALYMTNSSSIQVVGFVENSPTGTAVNGIFVDTNCARITLISPTTTSTNNTQSGSDIVTIIADNGANATFPGTTTFGIINEIMRIFGSSGTMFLSSNPDASEFNLGVDTTGTLSLYGSAGETLNLQLFDGQLTIATSHTPATSSDTGRTGQIAWDSSYIYVCVATNTWKRIAIATW